MTAAGASSGVTTPALVFDVLVEFEADVEFEARESDVFERVVDSQFLCVATLGGSDDFGWGRGDGECGGVGGGVIISPASPRFSFPPALFPLTLPPRPTSLFPLAAPGAGWVGSVGTTGTVRDLLRA